MKRLLKKIARKLGLLKATRQPDQSFFSYQIKDGTITCRWHLDAATQRRVQQNSEAGCLHLRLRQLNGLRAEQGISIASMKEVAVNSNSEWIALPTSTGTLLLELGYKQRAGDFVVLQFQHIDLGELVPAAAAIDDWFPIPKPQSMHEVMYELATKTKGIGGSERISS